VLDGVELGDGAVIAAGAVVRAGRYEGNAVYGGVPAKLLKRR
jgi:acetyltransferase-like isoleucine patch superfamily enzyme